MKRALIVGIDKYKGKGGSIYAGVKDANDIAKLIRRNEDESENFELIECEEVLTKGYLKEKLIQLFNKEAETALFYFAGHGWHDFFGYHLVTPDYQNHDMGVPMSQLLTIVQRSRAKNKVIILDCCHAAGADNEHPTNGMPTYLYDGMTILAASRPEQYAEEVNGHGVFTNLLIEALNGGAADLNGNISPGGIYAYIDKALGTDKQRPVFKTNISQFVSLRKVIPQVKSEVIKNLAVFFPSPHYHYLLDPSHEYMNTKNRGFEPQEPYADTDNVAKFKQLQQLQSIGLVVPHDADYMFFAAMESKACKLTPLGQHYWRLAKDGRL